MHSELKSHLKSDWEHAIYTRIMINYGNTEIELQTPPIGNFCNK